MGKLTYTVVTELLDENGAMHTRVTTHYAPFPEYAVGQAAECFYPLPDNWRMGGFARVFEGDGKKYRIEKCHPEWIGVPV